MRGFCWQHASRDRVGRVAPLAAAIDRPVIAAPPVLPPIEGSAGWEPFL